MVQIRKSTTPSVSASVANHSRFNPEIGNFGTDERGKRADAKPGLRKCRGRYDAGQGIIYFFELVQILVEQLFK